MIYIYISIWIWRQARDARESRHHWQPVLHVTNAHLIYIYVYMYTCICICVYIYIRVYDIYMYVNMFMEREGGDAEDDV